MLRAIKEVDGSINRLIGAIGRDLVGRIKKRASGELDVRLRDGEPANPDGECLVRANKKIYKATFQRNRLVRLSEGRAKANQLTHVLQEMLEEAEIPDRLVRFFRTEEDWAIKPLQMKPYVGNQ